MRVPYTDHHGPLGLEHRGARAVPGPAARRYAARMWSGAVIALALAAFTPAPAPAVPVVPPPVNGTFDYQIGGVYPPAPGVAIVDRDRSDPPAPGVYGVCYVNAFQAQPGEAAWWKAHHDDLLLRKNGRYVVDPGWNEILFDLSTPAKRAKLAAIEADWIDGCATAGYRAVEPDNLDSWTRSRGRLRPAQNLAFAALLAARAHADGLAIAQKNASEVARQGRRTVGFDFVIAEECQRYTGTYGRECDDYRHWYGDQVYEIEYPDGGGPANFAAACTARGAQISITYRDRDVTPRGNPRYVFDSC